MISRKFDRIFLRDFLFRAAALVTLATGVAAGSAQATTGTATPSYGTCPTSGLKASANTLNLKGNCSIVGDVNLSGNAALTMTGGMLFIKGNMILNGNAAVTVASGGLAFPQTNYSQYSITLNGNSQLSLTNSMFVTNGTGKNNFSMSLTANDYSVASFYGSNLNTDGGSWLLANIGSHAKLDMNNSQNLPTEIYPTGSSTVSLSASVFATVWLDFQPGSNGTVNIPAKDKNDNFSLSYGPSAGTAYSVKIQSGRGRLGLNSHPNSTMVVNGNGQSSTAQDADVVFGYYVENSTSTVNINGLSVGKNITRTFTDQGRVLQLNHVNLNPFAWQVYVSQSNKFMVTVSNSTVNEIAAFTNGLVNVSNSVLQLAVTGAVGPGSKMSINNTQIWSQTVQAQNGGQISINNSQLNGNFVWAAGAGSSISTSNAVDNGNGIPSQSCAPINGFPPNNNGVPLCNPYNPPHQCSQLVAPSAGATMTDLPTRVAGRQCPTYRSPTTGI